MSNNNGNNNIGNLVLMLSSKDPIIIDNTIEISLVEVVTENQVRIAIKAPKSVNIARLKAILRRAENHYGKSDKS